MENLVSYQGRVTLQQISPWISLTVIAGWFIISSHGSDRSPSVPTTCTRNTIACLLKSPVISELTKAEITSSYMSQRNYDNPLIFLSQLLYGYVSSHYITTKATSSFLKWASKSRSPVIRWSWSQRYCSLLDFDTTSCWVTLCLQETQVPIWKLHQHTKIWAIIMHIKQKPKSVPEKGKLSLELSTWLDPRPMASLTSQ